jgi:predicted nucleic acid-binding Zn ribbon protein
MSKTQRPTTVSLASALDLLTHELGIEQKLHEYEVVLYWDEIVGEQISKAASAVSIAKGVLCVRVHTAPWRNELNFRKKELMEKINKHFGEELVNDIRLQ